MSQGLGWLIALLGTTGSSECQLLEKNLGRRHQRKILKMYLSIYAFNENMNYNEIAAKDCTMYSYCHSECQSVDITMPSYVTCWPAKHGRSCLQLWILVLPLAPEYIYINDIITCWKAPCLHWHKNIIGDLTWFGLGNLIPKASFSRLHSSAQCKDVSIFCGLCVAFDWE